MSDFQLENYKSNLRCHCFLPRLPASPRSCLPLQVIAVIELAIIDDTEFELTETFNVSLVSVTGGGRLGDDVVLTVVIPQNDSPFGIFGFEETRVSLRYQGSVCS